MTQSLPGPSNTTGLAAPRGALRLMLDPTFGGLFWGKVTSAVAVWIHATVAAIVVFEATRSAFAVGLAVAAQYLPQILLSAWSGSMADRGHVFGQMVAGQMVAGRVLCTVGSGGLVLWLLLRGEADGWTGAWPVVISTFVVGLGFVVGGPAQQSIVPRLVTPEELSTAMTLNTAPMTIARITGPVIGALMVVHGGAAEAFALSVVGHVIFLALLTRITLPDAEPHEPGVDYSIRAGLSYVRLHRPLLLVLIGCAVTGISQEPSITLAPSLADELGGGAQLIGSFTSAFGLGAAAGLLIATLVLRRVAVETVATSGIVLTAMGSALAAVAFTPATAIAGFALTGVGFTFANAAFTTLAQRMAPPHLRGRVMAMWALGFLGSRPLAGFFLGAATDLTSVHLAIASIVLFLLAAAYVLRPANLRDTE